MHRYKSHATIDTHTNTYIHIYTHTSKYTYKYVHACMHACMHAHMCPHGSARIHTCADPKSSDCRSLLTYVPGQTYVYIPACLCMHTCAECRSAESVHACMYARVHASICARRYLCLSVCLSQVVFVLDSVHVCMLLSMYAFASSLALCSKCLTRTGVAVAH